MFKVLKSVQNLVKRQILNIFKMSKFRQKVNVKHFKHSLDAPDPEAQHPLKFKHLNILNIYKHLQCSKCLKLVKRQVLNILNVLDCLKCLNFGKRQVLNILNILQMRPILRAQHPLNFKHFRNFYRF